MEKKRRSIEKKLAQRNVDLQVGEKVVEFGGKDHVQNVQQFLKEGKTQGYALAGMKGGALITEAESAAELHARLHSLPFYPVLEIEIYPLLSVDEALTHAKAWAEATRARLAQGSH